MLNEHTPGTWQTGGRCRRVMANQGDGSLVPVADVLALHGPATPGKQSARARQREANGRLIAAAPDLLDACYAAIGAMRTVQDEHPWMAGILDSIMAAARKATTAPRLTQHTEHP